MGRLLQRNTIANNFFVAGVGRVIAGVFAFGATAFIARSLGPQNYGEYVTVTAFLYIFNALADFGLYSFLVNEISKSDAHEKELIGNVISLRMFFLAILLSAGVFLGNFLPYSSIVKEGLVIGALSYFFLSSAQVLMGVFQKYLTIWQATASEIIARSIQFALVAYFFIIHSHDVLVFLFVLAAASSVNFILVWFFALKNVAFKPLFSLARWVAITKTAFPIALSLIFTLIYFRLDTVLLSLFKPQHDVGVYNIAYKLLENIIFYPSMLVGLLMPMLSKEALHNKEKFRAIFAKGIKLLYLGALPMTLAGVLLARETIEVLGGQAFIDAVRPFQILLGATFFIFFGTILGATSIALGKQKSAIPIYFSAMVFNVIANLILIPRYSYTATATTTLFTEILVTVGLAVLVKRHIVLPSKRFLMYATIASIIPSAPILIWHTQLYNLVGFYALFFWTAFFMPVYGACLWLMKVFTKEDLDFLFGKSEGTPVRP